jgi:translation initiation factor 3 subunit B
MPQRESLAGGAPTFSGGLEFYNVDELVSVTTAEHTNASIAEWDPSGRYFVSMVSQWFQSIDTGFKLWSFQGKEERQLLRDQFFQFNWRPRPITLLTEKQLKDIKQNLSSYAKTFKTEDKKKKNEEKNVVRERRMEQRKAFEKYLKQKEEEYHEEEEEREALEADLPVVKFQLRTVMKQKVISEQIVEINQDWSDMNE